MNDAREAILSRLHSVQRQPSAGRRPSSSQCETPVVLSLDEKTDRLTRRLHATHAEVHDAAAVAASAAGADTAWLDVLQAVCQRRALKNLLLSPSGHWGRAICAQAQRFPTLIDYRRPIEAWKSDLFNSVDAAVTGCYGGIADTGALILWPDVHEPRAMSLIPPVHIVILEKRKIYANLTEAMHQQNWLQTGMPSNVVLVSGPSKSADIEQTMTYGVHGPKALIVILV